MSDLMKRLLVSVACIVLMVAAGVPALLPSTPAAFEAAASGVSILALATLVRNWSVATVRPNAR